MPKRTQKSTGNQPGKTASPGVRLIAEPQVGRGVYSNVAAVQHTPNEFVLDFLMQLRTEAQLVSRVVVSPQHAKALEKALKANLAKYEAHFGKILMKKTKRAQARR